MAPPKGHKWTEEQLAAKRVANKLAWEKRRKTVAERYWEKVDKSAGPDACWLWTACVDLGGYGMLAVERVAVHAHRVGWEVVHGKKPGKLFVLHKCDNPPCQNPKHWFLGNQQANMADCQNKDRSALKLTREQVIEMRFLRESENVPSQVLANRFGVCTGMVNRILRRKAWQHVL